MKKLAVIDDEPLIRKYLTVILSEKFEVISFSSAKDALNHFQKDKSIDFILSDYLMDDMNGLDLLDHLIKKNYFKNAKNSFCFMTAFENNEIHYKLIKSGCRVVGKSFLSIKTIEDFFE